MSLADCDVEGAVQGIVIGSAVFPIYCCLTWKKTSAFAAITGAPPI